MGAMREALRNAASQTPQEESKVQTATSAKSRWKKAVQSVKSDKTPQFRFRDAVVSALKAARESRRFARVVFLAASLLEKLPSDWENEDMFVALTSEPEEYEQVGVQLMASGETEMRERLRTMGIQE